jgi:hypothetical protein
MLTPQEAHDLQDLFQLVVYYVDLYELGDMGLVTGEKRKKLAMAAIHQISAKIVSLTPPAVAPWPGEECEPVDK